MAVTSVPLPMTPTDYMLGGKWPRRYLGTTLRYSSNRYTDPGTKVEYITGYSEATLGRATLGLSKSEIENSNESYLTAPIQAGNELEPDLALTNKIYLLDTYNGTREEYEIILHTEESRRKFIGEYKQYLCEDLLTHGLPIIHFSPLINYTFQKKVYTFDVEVLKALEIARHPVQQQVVEVFNHTYAKHLAEYPILLPATCNGEFVLFRAQHKSATQLLQKYFDYHMKYLTEQNTILDFIANYPFSKDRNFTMLWSTLFDTASFYGSTDRIKL